MIPLTRIRTTQAVHSNFYGAKRIGLNSKLLTKKRDGELEKESKDKWDASVWKQAKAQLLIESNNKCAYCETPTRVVAYGDVEHFRPKSKYWWLAYCYENYLVSCGVCNQEYKKDFFEIRKGSKALKGPKVSKTYNDPKLAAMAPLMTVDPVDDSKGMPLQDFIRQISDEYALIVNPYYEDPSEYFAWHPVPETQEVVVVAAKPAYKAVVTACENLFGINRKELMDLRFQCYALYATLRHTLNDPGISAQTKTMNQAGLAKMVQANAPYAGMIRYFEKQKLADIPLGY